ncbi:MAG TPA: response regulator [Clostridiales bacterium]|nr:response regulator [Clostridiales bacterium]HQP69259.1 response regulator [Clostridiales bacterium]
MKGRFNNYVFILLIVIISFLLIYYSYYFVKESRSKIIERAILSDRFNIEQASGNIESVISMLSKHLMLETEHHSDFVLDESSRNQLENSLKIHKPYISSVTRTDKNGIILYTVPDNKKLTGTDISYQEHVKKIISDHKPVFSDVFTAVQGYSAIALHAPVFTNGEYNGSLAYLISFDYLSDFLKEKYVRSFDENIQLIADNSGNILYCGRKVLKGKKISEVFSGSVEFVNKFRELNTDGSLSEFRFRMNGEDYSVRMKKISLPFENSWTAVSAFSETALLTKSGYIPLKFILLIMAIFGLLSVAVIKFRTMNIIIRDNEIKEKLERNLSSSQKLYKTILTDMTCIVCRLDRNKKIIFFNKPFYQKFKNKTLKIKGRDIVEILNENEAMILNSKLDEIGINKQLTAFEFPVNIKGEEYFFFFTLRALLDENGIINEYQLIGPDITEYKKAEQIDRIYNEKIRESERMVALGNLAAGVAHDFNNILMGIQGNTSLLKLKYDQNEEISSRIKLIEEQIKQASALSRQLLGMAKGGKYEITKFDPVELILSISEVFSKSNKNIVFENDLCEAKYAVEGDRSQIRQAFTNIILNAIQSITETGIVQLRAEFVEPGADFLYAHGLKKQKYLQLTVKDNGTGMDEEVKSRILDPFFTTRKKGKGSGLGLSSAYGIIKNHDGALEFDSVKFEGSEFRIFLPVTENEFIPSQPVKESFDTKDKTILVVDDEKMVLNATAEMLSYLGYQILKAENGRVAVDIFSNNRRISCVILDMIMPGMDGEKVFNELRKIDPSVKVIISSGYSMSAKVESMLMNGAKGFLEKPFSMDEISIKLRQVLEQN